MVNCFLCKNPVSNVQYHIKSVCINIYSAEEVCWFFSENMALAEEILNDRGFAVWLAEFCDVHDAVKALAGDTKASFSRKIIWLFGRVNYFTDGEMKQKRREAECFEKKNSLEKLKQQGDELLKNGKLLKSIELYRKIIEDPHEEERTAEFKAAINYNIGCAYARLFQTENAYDSFKKAYDTDKSECFLKGYLKAIYFREYNRADDTTLAKKAALAAIEKKFIEMNVSDKISHEIRREIKESDMAALPENETEALQSWVRAYHNAVNE